MLGHFAEAGFSRSSDLLCSVSDVTDGQMYTERSKFKASLPYKTLEKYEKMPHVNLKLLST